MRGWSTVTGLSQWRAHASPAARQCQRNAARRSARRTPRATALLGLRGPCQPRRRAMPGVPRRTSPSRARPGRALRSPGVGAGGVRRCRAGSHPSTEVPRSPGRGGRDGRADRGKRPARPALGRRARACAVASTATAVTPLQPGGFDCRGSWAASGPPSPRLPRSFRPAGNAGRPRPGGAAIRTGRSDTAGAHSGGACADRARRRRRHNGRHSCCLPGRSRRVRRGRGGRDRVCADAWSLTYHQVPNVQEGRCASS
jgi:hypothetical protein